MPSSRRIRCVRSIASPPAAGTFCSVCEDTFRRYPTPAQSITTWSGRRTWTLPVTQAIMCSDSGHEGGCLPGTSAARGQAREPVYGGTALRGTVFLRDGRSVCVADRQRQRVGGMIGRRWRLEPEQRRDHALHLLLARAAV